MKTPQWTATTLKSIMCCSLRGTLQSHTSNSICLPQWEKGVRAINFEEQELAGFNTLHPPSLLWSFITTGHSTKSDVCSGLHKSCCICWQHSLLEQSSLTVVLDNYDGCFCCREAWNSLWTQITVRVFVYCTLPVQPTWYFSISHAKQVSTSQVGFFLTLSKLKFKEPERWFSLKYHLVGLRGFLVQSASLCCRHSEMFPKAG